MYLVALRVFLRGPSRTPFESFPTPWSPFADSSFALLTDPLSPLVEIFSPFPTFGGSLLSFLQPLRGPSPFFVALRGYLFAFSWKSFLPLATLGGSLLSLLQPLRSPSCPFVDNSFSLRALRGTPLWISFVSFVDNPSTGFKKTSFQNALPVQELPSTPMPVPR